MKANEFENHPFRLTDAVRVLKHKSHPDGLHLESILSTFGSRSHGFLIIFLCIPFIQPLPLLGLSTPLGGMLALLGVWLMLGKHPWMPKRFRQLHIQNEIIQKSCDVLESLLLKVEKFIRPRWSIMTSHLLIRILNGFLVFIFAILLALPLPIPFSNSVPAYIMIFLALGILEEDGLLMILAYIMAIFGFIFFSGLAISVVHLIKPYL